MMITVMTGITIFKTEGKVQSLLDLTQLLHSRAMEHVRIQYTCGQSCMPIQVSTGEIQTPTHWNPDNHSETAPPPVISPSSILLPLLSHCAFITTWKNSGHVSKSFFFFFFFKLFKNHISKKTSVENKRQLYCYPFLFSYDNYVSDTALLYNVLFYEWGVCYKSIKTHSFKINGYKTPVQNHFHNASANSWCMLNSCNMKI